MPNITALVVNWRPDAVMVATEAHIQLAEVMRFCDVITLIPEAAYIRGCYELLT
ncbi:hypothetical protein NRB20_69730 [Nocardia sp. RB20]|uniref:Uncharacterized protein n=2 Tax=Nocardia macrotermitis TaxID=2585198 RepID=A0A7K0DDG4_9NOCA|nr:hypothetical protein [Nocardia macrotermitis]